MADEPITPESVTYDDVPRLLAEHHAAIVEIREHVAALEKRLHSVIFTGRVRRRSTAAGQKSNVAGESEIFKQNPQRAYRITQATGWDDVFPGTLNLAVAEESLTPSARSARCSWSSQRRSRIQQTWRSPRCAKGTTTYSGTVSVRGRTQEVLVKLAGKPHDERFVELVAPVQLMTSLQIDGGSIVEVAVSSA